MHRLVLHELRPRPGTTREIADLCATSDGEVLIQLAELNERIRNLLGYEDDPLTASAGGAWKADGVAGLLRLNDELELEVVPKFLDPTHSTWRADFFVLAVLVRTGHLLPHDDIAAGPTERGDLATLIARSLLGLYAENERRPIRGYRRVGTIDFAIDGDVDWETVYLPDPEGFAVSRLELTRKNPFNAALAAAVGTLVAEVTDLDTQTQLRQLERQLRPQPPVPTVFPPLPQRHQGWQQTYDLARLIVEGLGLNLNQGGFSGPGFVLSTWSAWESLCEEVLRRALPDHRVAGQEKWVLGQRGSSPVHVTPDISPLEGGLATFLLDAKYKTRRDRTPRISAGDLYESLAFLSASGAETLFLLYPALRGTDELALGNWRAFDRVDVDIRWVEGFEVQVQGLASRGGFDQLVRGAREALTATGVISATP